MADKENDTEHEKLSIESRGNTSVPEITFNNGKITRDSKISLSNGKEEKEEEKEKAEVDAEAEVAAELGARADEGEKGEEDPNNNNKMRVESISKAPKNSGESIKVLGEEGSPLNGKKGCTDKSLCKGERGFCDLLKKRMVKNEKLVKEEVDVRRRIDTLECSMPAILIWNMCRAAQNSRRNCMKTVCDLLQQQFQCIGNENRGLFPLNTTPSQHWDVRVREIEAERKLAQRKADEARRLLREKQSVLSERKKKLEEAKKMQDEYKCKIEELREKVSARGDNQEIPEDCRCASLTSIGSKDLLCLTKLQNLVESEHGMKKQIENLERREECYMRTLQKADQLWSKMEGDAGSLSDQLSLKTETNQKLAARICELEDELEMFKCKLSTCRSELIKFTGVERADAIIGMDDILTRDEQTAIQIDVKCQDVTAKPEVADVSVTPRVDQLRDQDVSAIQELADASVMPELTDYDDYPSDEGEYVCPPDFICNDAVFHPQGLETEFYDQTPVVPKTSFDEKHLEPEDQEPKDQESEQQEPKEQEPKEQGDARSFEPEEEEESTYEDTDQQQLGMDSISTSEPVTLVSSEIREPGDSPIIDLLVEEESSVAPVKFEESVSSEEKISTAEPQLSGRPSAEDSIAREEESLMPAEELKGSIPSEENIITPEVYGPVATEALNADELAPSGPPDNIEFETVPEETNVSDEAKDVKASEIGEEYDDGEGLEKHDGKQSPSAKEMEVQIAPETVDQPVGGQVVEDVSEIDPKGVLEHSAQWEKGEIAVIAHEETLSENVPSEVIKAEDTKPSPRQTSIEIDDRSIPIPRAILKQWTNTTNDIRGEIEECPKCEVKKDDALKMEESMAFYLKETNFEEGKSTTGQDKIIPTSEDIASEQMKHEALDEKEMDLVSDEKSSTKAVEDSMDEIISGKIEEEGEMRVEEDEKEIVEQLDVETIQKDDEPSEATAGEDQDVDKVEDEDTIMEVSKEVVEVGEDVEGERGIVADFEKPEDVVDDSEDSKGGKIDSTTFEVILKETGMLEELEEMEKMGKEENVTDIATEQEEPTEVAEKSPSISGVDVKGEKISREIPDLDGKPDGPGETARDLTTEDKESEKVPSPKPTSDPGTAMKLLCTCIPDYFLSPRPRLTMKVSRVTRTVCSGGTQTITNFKPYKKPGKAKRLYDKELELANDAPKMKFIKDQSTLTLSFASTQTEFTHNKEKLVINMKGARKLDSNESTICSGSCSRKKRSVQQSEKAYDRQVEAGNQLDASQLGEEGSRRFRCADTLKSTNSCLTEKSNSTLSSTSSGLSSNYVCKDCKVVKSKKGTKAISTGFKSKLNARSRSSSRENQLSCGVIESRSNSSTGNTGADVKSRQNEEKCGDFSSGGEGLREASGDRRSCCPCPVQMEAAKEKRHARRVKAENRLAQISGGSALRSRQTRKNEFSKRTEDGTDDGSKGKVTEKEDPTCICIKRSGSFGSDKQSKPSRKYTCDCGN